MARIIQVEFCIIRTEIKALHVRCGEIGKLSQPGQPLYNIEVSNGGLITFPGGAQIHDKDDVLIGGIGVSGSTVENDLQVAVAGENALFGKLK